MHLNLYGSPVADDSTLCTQWWGVSDWLGPSHAHPYGSALNGGKASDWLRPVPCRQEGDKLPKGQY